MAAPIGHIYLALKLLAGPLQDIDEQAFILGVSFPDIRYAAHILREYTHKSQVTWCDVVNEPDAFEAGMMFHVLVDNMREKYFETHDITPFALQRFGNPVNYLVKTAEDIVLFKCLCDTKFARYFDVILDQEKKIVDNEHVIRMWHNAIKNYFTRGPTPQSLVQLLGKNYRVRPVIFYQLSDLLARTKSFVDQVIGFYDNFETILANSFSADCIRA